MGYSDDKITNTTTITGNQGELSAVLDFAKRRTETRHETFKDPLGIAPDVIAVLGHDKDGGTTVDAIDFERDGWLDRPRRRRGTIKVTTLESFVALVNRQSGEQSVIFADDGPRPSLTAVMNFHEAGDDGKPEFCDDKIVYEFPLSEEWKRWMGQNGKQLGQTEFAEFIENNLFDIGDPGCAGKITTAFASEGGIKLAGRQALLGLSKGLSVRVEHRVARTVNLQSGEGRIEFSEEHRDEGGGPLIVPSCFHLYIPVFRGGGPYSIPVRLRYRTGGGKVTWFFEIHRADLFLQDAVKDALYLVLRQQDAKDEAGNLTPGCGLPVFMGTAP